MEVTELEIEETPINFRLHKMKTLVFSAALHYYDEVNKHLTLPEDFISYFFANQNKFRWLLLIDLSIENASADNF